jgi:hypothetical protein
MRSMTALLAVALAACGAEAASYAPPTPPTPPPSRTPAPIATLALDPNAGKTETATFIVQATPANVSWQNPPYSYSYAQSARVADKCHLDFSVRTFASTGSDPPQMSDQRSATIPFGMSYFDRGDCSSSSHIVAVDYPGGVMSIFFNSQSACTSYLEALKQLDTLCRIRREPN